MNHARLKPLAPLADSGDDERGLLSAAELDFSEYRVAMERSRKRYAFVPSQRPRAGLLRLAAFNALLAHNSPAYRLRVAKTDLPADARRVSNHDLVGLSALNQICARRLGVAAAQLYVSASTAQPLLACGAGHDALMVLARTLAEQLSASALRFLLGQGLGRVHFYSVVSEQLFRGKQQRLHVAQLRSLPSGDGAQLVPWRRAAQITADRAGLFCAGNLADAQHALSRLASSQIADPLGERQGTVGMPTPGSVSTPQSSLSLTVRIRMLRLFAESELFRGSQGLEGGRPLSAVDAEVERWVLTKGRGSSSYA